MLALLERLDPDHTDIDVLVALFDTLRPAHPLDHARAGANVRTLCQLLKGNPTHAGALRRYTLRILGARRHTSLYTDIGVLSNDGFFTELIRRLAYRLLPPALGEDYLSDALDQILYLDTDHQWIGAVPGADWLALFDVLAGATTPDAPDAPCISGIWRVSSVSDITSVAGAAGVSDAVDAADAADAAGVAGVADAAGVANAAGVAGRPATGGLDEPCPVMLSGMLDAIRTLSYRVCAIGLEPALARFHTEIETFASPFTMQNVEVNAYLDAYARLLAGADEHIEDARHLLVMLDQCDAVVGKIRKKALVQGTSIALTYMLVALTQSTDRLRKLLFLVDLTGELPGAPTAEPATPGGLPPSEHTAAPAAAADPRGAPRQSPRNARAHQAAADAGAAPGPDAPSPRRAAALALALELIAAHNNKYKVRELLTDNIDLLARNITENASRTGEHYIADSRQQLGAMFRSSAGAGCVIGFMALFKILLSYLRAAPLVEAFLFSINYSLGFMFIHVLHFTVATKQPAMTASRIAAGLQSKDGRNIDLDSMAELINKVLRTQLMAVLGNLATALPTAWLIALAWHSVTGQHLVNPDKARHLLRDIDPLAGPTLFYALIAGACLFVAGLISGYYDNAALYTRWSQRVTQLRTLGRLLGRRRLKRLGLYLEDNLGGLMGNFYFGVLLGSIGTLGFLLGLPLDIRHITFSAANFATALVGLEHDIGWLQIARALAGVLGIGAVNLIVSFGLALWVALRARQVRFRHGITLLKTLGRRFLQAPLIFFIGPPAARPGELETERESP